MKNPSRIPVIFAVEPPRASTGVLHVSPLVGLLLGNQTATLQIAFAPREMKGYRFKIPVKVSFPFLAFQTLEFFCLVENAGQFIE